MSATVGDHLLERLASGGVRRIYGYPGDGINGIMEGSANPALTIMALASRLAERLTAKRIDPLRRLVAG